MTAVRRWQIGLLAFGVILVLVGVLVLLYLVAPAKYGGILVWFAGALILHDGIIAPVVFGISVLMRKAGTRIPLAVLAIIQGAIVVGAVIALIVFPEIVKKSIGSNPTVLPLDYAPNLVVFYGVLVVLTAAVVAVYLRVFARRQKLRPSSSQD